MVYLSDGVRTVLRKSGGWSALVGAGLQLVLGVSVLQAQPDIVKQGLNGNMLATVGGYLFVATAALTGVLGLLQALKKAGLALGVAGILTAFLSNVGSVVARDGIRDATLKAKGFDVWNRVESSNWSVVILFLLLFVIMLFVVYWLLGVMRKATPPTEQVSL